MEQPIKNFFAAPQPNEKGYQISYEVGSSRKVHQFNQSVSAQEQPPHGAGSYHNPDQHYNWMQSVFDYIKNENT